jgi:serine O-acetyltransferase
MTCAPDWLAGYVCRQLENFYPDGHDSRTSIEVALPRALTRAKNCIRQVRVWQSGFDPLMSGQYATFLYFLSNEVWRSQADGATATRLFLLNKALHGLELFYEVALPEIFLIGHTPGLTFAKATYGTHLVFHQSCTVGHKLVGERPVLEDRIVMFPNSMVIGRCRIRSNTVIAPGVCLVDTDTPGNCYVLPGPGRPIFKPAKREVWRDYFID